MMAPGTWDDFMTPFLKLGQRHEKAQCMTWDSVSFMILCIVQDLIIIYFTFQAQNENAVEVINKNQHDQYTKSKEDHQTSEQIVRLRYYAVFHLVKDLKWSLDEQFEARPYTATVGRRPWLLLKIHSKQFYIYYMYC